MRTFDGYNSEDGVDIFEHNPWRSPGSAPIFSPCGVGGGNPNGCPEGGPHPEEGELNCPGGGYSHGPKAEDVTFPGVVTTDWALGSSQEVAWGITANHGGGYSYRLCKVPEEGVSGITEDCFRQTVLNYEGTDQWVQYGLNQNNRTAFKASRTTKGTNPAGSTWTKDPIPACSGPSGGFDHNTPDFKEVTQFPPPVNGLFGFGTSYKGNPDDYTFQFGIVDKVVVPADLTPGEYVLSFRWDCEQTSQVWTTCSSIRLVDPNASTTEPTTVPSTAPPTTFPSPSTAQPTTVPSTAPPTTVPSTAPPTTVTT